MRKVSFERRHYEFLAQIIRAFPIEQHYTRNVIAHHFSQWLKATNPRFDDNRFKAACFSDVQDKKV